MTRPRSRSCSVWLGLAVLWFLVGTGCNATPNTSSVLALTPTVPPPPTIAVLPKPTQAAVPTIQAGNLQVVEKKFLFANAGYEKFLRDWSADGKRLLFQSAVPTRAAPTPAYQKRMDPISDGRTAEPVNAAAIVQHWFPHYEFWVYSAADSSFTKLLDYANDACFSTDGQTVYYSVLSDDWTAFERYSARVDGNDRQLTGLLDATALDDLSLLADGSVVLSRGQQLRTLTADGEEIPWPDGNIESLHHYAGSISVSPDGWSAIVNTERTIDYYRRDKGKTTLIAKNYPEDLNNHMFRLSPNGRQIVFSRSHWEAEMKIIDVESASATTILNRASDWDEFFPYLWSQDGSRIFFSRQSWRSGKPMTLWVVNPDGTGLQQLADDAMVAATSPDGTKVLISSAPGCSLLTIK